MFNFSPTNSGWVFILASTLLSFSFITDSKAENPTTQSPQALYIGPIIDVDPTNITSGFLLTIENKTTASFDDCFGSLAKNYKRELEQRFRITGESEHTSIKDGILGKKYVYQLQPKVTGEFLIEGASCETLAIKSLETTANLFTKNNPHAIFELITKSVDVKTEHYKISG